MAIYPNIVMGQGDSRKIYGLDSFAKVLAWRTPWHLKKKQIINAFFIAVTSRYGHVTLQFIVESIAVTHVTAILFED